MLRVEKQDDKHKTSLPFFKEFASKKTKSDERKEAEVDYLTTMIMIMIVIGR